ESATPLRISPFPIGRAKRGTNKTTDLGRLMGRTQKDVLASVAILGANAWQKAASSGQASGATGKRPSMPGTQRQKIANSNRVNPATPKPPSRPEIDSAGNPGSRGIQPALLAAG